MWPGMRAINQDAAIPASGEWNLLAMPASGMTIRAPQTAGCVSTDHQTASSSGISVSHERKIPPIARDHENRGGLGFKPPTG